jgi:mRNA-degrading endonuclease YafQ of YafQ-DinJ toxin-antitoxin module
MQKKKRQQRRKYYTIMDEMMASPTEPLPVAHRTHQLTMMYGGLNAMETAPTPTTDDWRVVSDAINLMETLVVEMKVCEDSSGLLMDAITALALAGKRNRAGGTIRMDGAGIQAVRSILSDYAELLNVLPARTMYRCHRLTEKRLHDLLDGKRRPHDVEITSM